MKLANYRKKLQIGALATILLASSSVKNEFAAGIVSSESRNLEKENHSEKNNSDSYFIPSYYALSETDAKKIAQLEIINKAEKNNDQSIINLLYSTNGLDEYMESALNYAPSPREEAFDRTLKKVLQYPKYRNIDSTLIDYYMLKASAWQESRFDSTIVSKANAIGYMQVRAPTHLSFRPQDRTLKERFKPENNIEAGIDYYLYLMDYVKNNHPRADTLSNEDIVNYAIAGYNSGHDAFTRINTPQGRKPKPEYKKWKIEFMPKESRNHLVYVRDKMNELKQKDKITEYARQYISIRDKLLGKNNSI